MDCDKFLNFRITTEMKRKLQRLADRKKMALSALVKQILQQHLDENR